jgi:hypothetical protein
MMDMVIHGLLAARPFVPFRVGMADGSGYAVEDADLAVVHGGVVDVYRRKPGSARGRDRVAMLSVRHIVCVTLDDDGPAVVGG